MARDFPCCVCKKEEDLQHKMMDWLVAAYDKPWLACGCCMWLHATSQPQVKLHDPGKKKKDEKLQVKLTSNQHRNDKSRKVWMRAKINVNRSCATHNKQMSCFKAVL